MVLDEPDVSAFVEVPSVESTVAVESRLSVEHWLRS